MEKVAGEVADLEFDRLCKYYNVDTNPEYMDEKDLESFNNLRRKLTFPIREGHLTVDEGGVPTYAMQYEGFEALTSLTFKVPTGHAIASWDKFSDREGIKKLNSYMGNMTSQTDMVFIKMDGRDLQVCQAIVTLFLAS